MPTLDLDPTIGISSPIFPAQDYIHIGGKRSPGKATIQGVNSPRGWDVRKGYAQTGAFVVPTGDELSTFQVLFELWTAEHIVAWYQFAAANFDRSVRFQPGTITPVALSISHPTLSAPPLRITSVVVTDASALENDDYGLWSCTVSFLQYRAPIIAPARPSAVMQTKSATVPTAQDAEDQQIEDRRSTFAGLNGGGA